MLRACAHHFALFPVNSQEPNERLKQLPRDVSERNVITAKQTPGPVDQAVQEVGQRQEGDHVAQRGQQDRRGGRRAPGKKKNRPHEEILSGIE